MNGTPFLTGRSVPMKEILLSELTIVSPLAFPLTLKSRQVILKPSGMQPHTWDANGGEA